MAQAQAAQISSNSSVVNKQGQNGSKKTLQTGKKQGMGNQSYPLSGKMVLNTNLGGKKNG